VSDDINKKWRVYLDDLRREANRELETRSTELQSGGAQMNDGSDTRTLRLEPLLKELSRLPPLKSAKRQI
jgi:hypothetical protein